MLLAHTLVSFPGSPLAPSLGTRLLTLPHNVLHSLVMYWCMISVYVCGKLLNLWIPPLAAADLASYSTKVGSQVSSCYQWVDIKCAKPSADGLVRSLRCYINTEAWTRQRHKAESGTIVSTNVLGTRLLFSPYWNEKLKLPSLYINNSRHLLSF